MLLIFATTTIYFQFPNKDTADLGDYFFACDVDEKSAAVISFDFLPQPGYSEKPLAVFERFLEIPNTPVLNTQPLNSHKGCRSPPPTAIAA